MSTERKEREGEQFKKIIEILKEGPITKEELIEKHHLKRQTVEYNIRKLKKQKRLYEIDGRLELVDPDKLAPDDATETLIKFMEEGPEDVRKVAAEEFKHLCGYKIPAQSNAVDWLINAIKQKEFESILPLLIDSLIKILETAKADNNKELIAKIINQENIDNMVKIAENASAESARILALQFLWKAEDKRAYPIFPKLLSVDQKIYSALESDIRWGFKVYSKIEPNWVRRDLYNLLSKADIKERVKIIILETLPMRYGTS